MIELPISQKRRHILHIDADAFFATVEQVLNPSLRGKPILVGGSKEHGIVSAASYEARRFGIHSGMAMYIARKKCPHAIVVKGHFHKYREFSQRMFQVMLSYTPDVEMCSIDEAYLDISGVEKMYRSEAREVARSLLLDINRKVGISVSCGMASSKTVAKVGSSQNKPHKFTVVPFGKEKAFLADLPLRALPGIGPRTRDMLQRFGYTKIGHVSGLSFCEVMDRLGLRGIELWKKCCGIDNRPVVSSRALPKSISKERSFYEYGRSRAFYIEVLKSLGDKVFMKLRRHKMRARTICIKIKYKNLEKGGRKFEYHTFQHNLGLPSASDRKLFGAARKLFLENVDFGRSVRLIGLGVAGLISNYNLSLFGRDLKEEKLFYDIDKLKNRYGTEIIEYGIY